MSKITREKYRRQLRQAAQALGRLPARLRNDFGVLRHGLVKIPQAFANKPLRSRRKLLGAMMQPPIRKALGNLDSNPALTSSQLAQRLTLAAKALGHQSNVPRCASVKHEHSAAKEPKHHAGCLSKKRPVVLRQIMLEAQLYYAPSDPRASSSSSARVYSAQTALRQHPSNRALSLKPKVQGSAHASVRKITEQMAGLSLQLSAPTAS